MTDDWEDDGEEAVDAALARFGLPAKLADRSEIIAGLEEEITRDEECDETLMRLLCAQLFSLGVAEDSLLIWRAKSLNFDTFCGIDVQLLCGAGLEQTKAFLADAGTEDAAKALEYLGEAEESGDFDGFDLEKALAEHRSYYDAP
jgi:hypothetical protein